MPNIYDNVELSFSAALRNTLDLSYACDFCIGYFNLRGWQSIDDLVEKQCCGDEDHCAKVIIGMHQTPDDEVREIFRIIKRDDEFIDEAKRRKLKAALLQSFQKQLTYGIPNNTDEEALHRLVHQLQRGKVQVRFYIRYPLHAKLYLLHRDDPNVPIVGYLGSSNLTAAGLSKQGELNVDVMDSDACKKLHNWFMERWNDKRGCLDVGDELANLIEEGWARSEPRSPYHIYLKMAYHLSQDARTGLSGFSMPAIFKNQILEFQEKAVALAVQNLNRRNGVLLADVVGLGKTLMATAVARIYQEDRGGDVLVICPANLTKMWEYYIEEYQLAGKAISIEKAVDLLPKLQHQYRLLVIDESHNLRNRDGKRYHAISDYIERCKCACMLLTATPYNKHYIDLSSQLRLFVDERQDLGIKPEVFFRTTKMSEAEFQAKFQASARSLLAFEQSDSPDDWRDLMRLFMVRRTRNFIKDNYAKREENSDRYFLTFANGNRFYFPRRVPKTLQFKVNEKDPNDEYGRLYRHEVVDTIGNLALPRYGLSEYLKKNAVEDADDEDKSVIGNLSQGGSRLIGYCRTNLFKRLESSGYAFLCSLDRHILRNMIYVHALENGLKIPIGTQETVLLDSSITDKDNGETNGNGCSTPNTLEEYKTRAETVYSAYQGHLSKNFSWISSSLFSTNLKKSLLEDSRHLLEIMNYAGHWDPSKDEKLAILQKLIQEIYPKEKILVFSQFADTCKYLCEQLKTRGIHHVECVTGDDKNPTYKASLFSPASNNHKLNQDEKEIRVLISTDVLSEGQNLQDSHIIVNYDLPWAIIRLIQRAGRVDRIGQKSADILVYSFIPADGVEKLIQLQSRLVERLTQNGEVIGSDETFFDGQTAQKLRNIYTEKSDSLEDPDEESDVDLQSYAYQIWENATKDNPQLKKQIEQLPDVVYATKKHESKPTDPDGVLVYLRTQDDTDSLIRINNQGEVETQSLIAVLKAAQCPPETKGLPKNPEHHQLVSKAITYICNQQFSQGGQLGDRRSARRKVYERLSAYYRTLLEEKSLFATDTLDKCIQAVYSNPLTTHAREVLNRQFRAGILDPDLSQIVQELWDEGRLTESPDDKRDNSDEPRILCSMGLFPNEIDS